MAENKIIENYKKVIQLASLFTPNHQPPFDYTSLYDKNEITDICDLLLYDMSIQLVNTISKFIKKFFEFNSFINRL
jgi:hypothetical protein